LTSPNGETTTEPSAARRTPTLSLSEPGQTLTQTSTARTSNTIFPGDGIVSHCSRVYYGEAANLPDFVEAHSVTSPYRRQKLFTCLEDDMLPRIPLYQAWLRIFMGQVYHHCPVVEIATVAVEDSSKDLLKKAICMAANIARQDPTSLLIASELYERVKILINTTSALDQVDMLQIVCLLSLWNPKPITRSFLDGSGHWIGVGLRLAIHLGLNRESTYSKWHNHGTLRKIFWYLYVSGFITEKRPFMRF